MRRKIIRLNTILLGMIFIFGLGFYSLSSVPDANLTVKGASGKAGTTNNLVSIEVTSNIDVRGIQFTLKDDPDVLTPTTVSLNPPGASIDKQDYLEEGLSVIIFKSDSGIIIPAGGMQTIEIRYNVADNTPDMQVNLDLIDVKLADKDGNPITTTVINSYFSIRSPETILPTIDGPYVGQCRDRKPVKDMTFGSDVEMNWSHYDNPGGSGIDTNSVTVGYKDPQGNPTDLTPVATFDQYGGSFIFPASSLAGGGPYKIIIRVCDRDTNCAETTADVSVTKSDTCKPTILYDGLYYSISCRGNPYYIVVNNVTFRENADVSMFWWHTDDSGGLCLDTGINTATVSVGYKLEPGGYYTYLIPTVSPSGGSFVFPIKSSTLANGDYTIKVSVCDKKSPTPNCAEVTALLHVQKSP